MGERSPHTREVTGSKPVGPTSGRPAPLRRPIARRVAQGRAQVGVFFLLALVVYLPTADYDLEQNFDIFGVAFPVWSVVERGTIDVQPYEETSPWFFESQGRYVSNRWPGTMVFALPVYAVASPLVSDDVPALWPATITACVVAAAAAAALFALAYVTHGAAAAWIAGSVAAFGTGLWTVAAESLWTHGPGVLMIALALHALRRRRQWLAGVWFGCLGLIRLHLLVAVAIVGYVLARERRDAWTLVRLGVPSAIGLVLYLLYAGHLTGDGVLAMLPYAFEAPEGWQRLANLAGLVVAPRVGLLVYTPVIVCCAPRVRAAWREAADWERAAFVGAVVYLLVQFQSNFFFGGFGFYGYRLPLEGLALAFPLLVRSGVLFMRASRTRAAALAGLAAYSVCVSAIGAVFFRGETGVDLPAWTTFGPWQALAGQAWPTTVIVCALSVAVISAAAWAAAAPRRPSRTAG